MGTMAVKALTVGPFQSNAFILRDDAAKNAVVIDPGDDASAILKILKRDGLKLQYIFLTHGHIDHVGGAKELKDATGAKVLIHMEDLFLYEKVHLQADLFGLPSPPVSDIDIFFEDGMEIGEGDLRCRIIHTPGHTPGSVSLYFSGKLFTGDSLFRDGIGRTDLWGGSHDVLMNSIREKLLRLDDATEVYPGHGPATTIGREKRENPFLQEIYQ